MKTLNQNDYIPLRQYDDIPLHLVKLFNDMRLVLGRSDEGLDDPEIALKPIPTFEFYVSASGQCMFQYLTVGSQGWIYTVRVSFETLLTAVNSDFVTGILKQIDPNVTIPKWFTDKWSEFKTCETCQSIRHTMIKIGESHHKKSLLPRELARILQTE